MPLNESVGTEPLALRSDASVLQGRGGAGRVALNPSITPVRPPVSWTR